MVAKEEKEALAVEAKEVVVEEHLRGCIFTEVMGTIPTSPDTAWNETSTEWTRVVIGSKGSIIGGAVYLKRGVELPKALIIKLNV